MPLNVTAASLTGHLRAITPDFGFDSPTILPIAVAITAIFFVFSVFGITQGSTPQVGKTWLPSLFQLTSIDSNLKYAAKKHPNSIFTTPVFPFGHMAVANSSKLIEEIRSGPDDVFSTKAVLETFVQSDHTIGPIMANNGLHKAIIRHRLAQELEVVFPEIVEESEIAIKSFFSSVQNDWASFPALKTFTGIFAQAANRVFVGAEICRTEKYREDMLNHAMQVMKTAYVINAFPQWAHKLVARIVARPEVYVRRVMRILEPSIRDIKAGLKGSRSGRAQRPNILLTWLLDDGAEDPELVSNEDIISSVLFMNFASIHTTASIFTHVMFDLACHPEFVPRLRKEAASVIGTCGWSLAGTQKMHDFDSFIRESARMNPTMNVALPRYLTSDWQFSNGTIVKKGTFMGAAMLTAHFNAQKYPEPERFDPWRFHRDDNSETDVKYRFTTTSADFLPFGAGKHACPGRFFASSHIKLLLAIIVLNYDVKHESEGGRPRSIPVGNSIMPNAAANIMLRKRKEGYGVFPSSD